MPEQFELTIRLRSTTSRAHLDALRQVLMSAADTALGDLEDEAGGERAWSISRVPQAPEAPTITPPTEQPVELDPDPARRGDQLAAATAAAAAVRATMGDR